VLSLAIAWDGGDCGFVSTGMACSKLDERVHATDIIVVVDERNVTMAE